jgi:arsenate reductase
MMTCGHADENCPFIPGALARLPFRFDDPKQFDDTPLEQEKYNECSLEIARELYYILQNIAV